MKKLLRRFLRFRWKWMVSGTLATAGATVLVSAVFMVIWASKERGDLRQADVPAKTLERLEYLSAETTGGGDETV